MTGFLSGTRVALLALTYLASLASSSAVHAAYELSLRVSGGQYVVAGDARENYRVGATANGIGRWEVFSVELEGGQEARLLRSGDRIHLRTHHGRYLMARNGGGADLTGEAQRARSWETFTIEKTSGSGEIAHGDQITLRAVDGIHFVMATNAGGGSITVESRNQSVWETFTLELRNAQLVQLRTFSSAWVSAEGGGGQRLTARATGPEAWRTFSLVNLSRPAGFRDGDAVALQAWDGRFVSAVGGGGGALLVNANRATASETFRISKGAGGEIAMTDSVSFRTPGADNFIMAQGGGGGEINAVSNQARQWETFRLVPAETSPMGFASALSAPVSTGHPLVAARPRVAGSRRLATFLIGFQDRAVDGTISTPELRDFLFGPTRSVRSWVSKMSFGAQRVIDAGTFGPMTVPWTYDVPPGAQPISDQDYFEGILRLARAQGFDFSAADLSGDGVVTGDELQLVIVDCTDAFKLGQKRSVSFTFAGLRYSGEVLTVGIYKRGGPVQGRAQLEGVMGTVTHELAHLLFNTPDRYYNPFPVRGDVVASGDNRAEWETLAFMTSDGSPPVHGSRVRLQVPFGGDFLVFESSERKLLNRGGSRADPLGEFLVQRAGGSGLIRHGDGIALRSVATGRYLMAEGGGGSILRVVATAPSVWETFTIELVVGDGQIRSGDGFTLRSSAENVFRRSFFLMAQPEGRTTDPGALARGWWTAWGANAPGDSAGGDYDIMDNDKARGMLSAYDRITRGWIPARVLRPDNKACYVLRPSADFAEAFLLWDPLVPDEWFVAENRQRREGFDEIPSSGLIVTWVNESASYWSQWEDSGAAFYPALISAASSRVPPNALFTLPMRPGEFFKRRSADAAFRSGTHVLPKGDGTPSRFRISVAAATSTEAVAFCIR